MTNKAKELAIHDKDTGSSEVQVAQLTDKIENLSKHIKQFKKDKHSSVGLLRAVNRRKKFRGDYRKIKVVFIYDKKSFIKKNHYEVFTKAFFCKRWFFWLCRKNWKFNQTNK